MTKINEKLDSILSLLNEESKALESLNKRVTALENSRSAKPATAKTVADKPATDKSAKTVAKPAKTVAKPATAKTASTFDRSAYEQTARKLKVLRTAEDGHTYVRKADRAKVYAAMK